MGEVTCALCLSMSVCSFLFVQLIKVVSIIFVVLSGLAWMVQDTLPKKESFQFCFSYKISMNVTLKPRHYSVLGRSWLDIHPFWCSWNGGS